MRVSDADRQRAIDELRRHCAAGRLDVDEYAARIEAVLAAVTFEELDRVRADLPMMRIAEPGSAGGVWALSGRPRPAVATGASQDGGDGQPSPAVRARLVALCVALLSVAVVVAAVAMAFAAEWVWALMLLAGWAAGVLQGRIRRPAGRPVTPR